MRQILIPAKSSTPMRHLFLVLVFALLFTSLQAQAPTPKPPDAPAAWKPFIGEYGSGDNAYSVIERNGKLMLIRKDGGEGTLSKNGPNDFALSSGSFPIESSVLLHRDANGAISLQLGSQTLQRHSADPGNDQARIKPVAPVDQLRAAALVATPPHEYRQFRQPDLVEIAALDPAIHLDIRYATSNDFLGVPVYTQARAFLQRPAAEALLRVQKKMQPLGYGLLIHDAYRPWYVTKIFWDATPPAGKIYVADPAEGSRHNRACAVDLTLYDLQSGQTLDMPGAYDEMSPRSFPDYPGGTSLERWNRDLLRRYMESEGFTVYEHEWWHFDYKDWRQYPILNIPFENIPLQN
jgi:D-alanyl-D-alanine dipeptidase